MYTAFVYLTTKSLTITHLVAADGLQITQHRFCLSYVLLSIENHDFWYKP